MILDRFSLNGKVAIVTGAGRGIGKAIALAFAEAGAAVVIAEINAEMGQRTVREISTGVGVKAQFIATDVSSKESVLAMVDTAVTTFGHVDILVNNAAGDMASQPTGAAIEMSESGFESDLRLCLTSVFTCSKAVARVMLEQKAGSIINISSRESQMPSVGLLAYGAAKSGVNSLTKTLAWELAPHVRVNAILPGCIWTEVAAQRLGPFKDQIIAATPLKRPGTPKDIALTALYLASSASDWVTGKLFEVDGDMEFMGGIAAHMPDILVIEKPTVN